MDHNESNKDTHRSIRVMGCQKDAEHIMDREGHQRGSLIKKENEATSVHHHLKFKKLKYFKHINRHGSMHTTLLNSTVNGKRGRGRPRIYWTSNINEWTGKSYIEADRLTNTNKEGFKGSNSMHNSRYCLRWHN